MRIYVFAAVILGCVPACTRAREQSDQQQWREDEHVGIISGVVVDDLGQPVAGATVSVPPVGRPFMGILPSVETDGEGKFTFDRFAWGKYAVCAHKEAEGYREICNSIFSKDSAPTVTLSPQAPRAGVLVIVGPKAGTVSGTVTDAVTGAPMNAVLRIRPSRDNGRFFDQGVSPQFNSLVPPDADLELEVRAPGYQLWRSSVDGYQQGKPVRVKSEEKRTLEIRLWPEPH